VLVVDLRHWLLPDGSLAPQARLAPHIAMVVECATSGIGDGITTMVCRHHDGRRRCAGRIGIARRDDTINWSCNTCDDAGVITGWQGTRWDLSKFDIGPDDDELVLYLALDELRAVRDLDLPAVIRATLAAAPAVDDGHACVTLTEVEVSRLLGAITGADARGVTRRTLDRALGRAEQVLLALRLARRATAH
jgi:hypothetical protein